jgi:hypothetical protein
MQIDSNAPITGPRIDPEMMIAAEERKAGGGDVVLIGTER